MGRPIAPACARNRDAILQIISGVLSDKSHVLEIGAGTGEHGVYFAEKMPWLSWQCTDRKENLNGIKLWVEHCQLPNLPNPIELDVNQPGKTAKYDAIFTANTLHIMSLKEVEKFFRVASLCIHSGGTLIVYGPFNYEGKFTSTSNAQFEQWLKSRDPSSGIKDFEWIQELANLNRFSLMKDNQMPANNRCLIFQKI